MARVKLEGITKAFGNTIAVDNVNLDIKDGEFLVLVGPSGCGKSTTLRMVAGLEMPTAGEIYIGEKKVTNLEPKDRDIAMVFQSYALYPHKNVFDNMAFGLQMRKLPKQEIERRVKEAAEMLDMTEYLKRTPKQLSGGQRQRVALGRAIVRHAQVFLMDEPLSNLDAKLRVQTRAELIKLHQRLKTTTIYVTHDQTEAMTMGDRIVVMKNGVVQQVGSSMEIYENPANSFVAGFVGSPPMNFIAGVIEIQEGKVVFKSKSINFEFPQSALKVSQEKIAENREVTLGIRPEYLEPVSADATGTHTISGEVEVVEHIVSESLVHMKIQSGEEVVVCLSSSKQKLPQVGTVYHVKPVRGNVHLFSAQNGGCLASESIDS